MNFVKVFSYNYIFNPAPPSESKFYPLLLAVFGAMVAYALAIVFVDRKEKTLLTKFKIPALTCGILGFVYALGRYESLPWICTRFYLLLVSVSFFVWSLTIAIMLIRYAPKHKHEIKTELRYSKYLPKSKKRG